MSQNDQINNEDKQFYPESSGYKTFLKKNRNLSLPPESSDKDDSSLLKISSIPPEAKDYNL